MTDDLRAHYGSASLTERILAALHDGGVDLDQGGTAALGGVDEFHLGGHRATLEVAAALDPSPGEVVVDIGSGIGGAARHLAGSHGCRVHGVDLTPEFVATATELTAAVGLDHLVDFRVGSGTDLPFDDATVDGITMLHVGMNIQDKETLAGEMARILRPSGQAVIYDIMRMGDGEITYPVPWAPTPEWSFVEPPGTYLDVLTSAGMSVDAPRDLTPLVLEVLATTAPPPAATLVDLMGADFPAMIANLVPAVRTGILAPTLLVASR